MPALLRSAALLLLLGLCGAPSGARAQDPAPEPGAGSLDPADKNRDGVVTRREARQYRRAQRRARRSSSGGRESDERADAAADAADADASAARSDAAMGKAASAAESLRRSLAPAEAGALGAGAPGGATGAASRAASGSAPEAAVHAGPAAAGSTGASGGPHDLANPRTVADFALAARSGYAPAFAAAGLKLSADGRSIVRLDGSPATAADLALLRSGILALPAALARRPDFFSRVSREHYADLKREYRARPDLADTVYKHVGATENDRDFIHTASCSKLSGDCNKNVESASYKKGDLVAPEDLDRMWEALQKDLDADAEGRAPHEETAAKGEAGASPAAASPDPLSPESAAKAEKTAGAASSGPAGAPAAAVAAAVGAAKKAWSRAREVVGPNVADAARRAALPIGVLAAAGALAAAFVAARRRT